MLSWFFQLIHLSLIQLLLYFYAMVYLNQNLKYQIYFQRVLRFLYKYRLFLCIEWKDFMWKTLSLVKSLISLCFLTFFIDFPKSALFINLKKKISVSLFVFFLRSVFISIYGFSQAFWLNLITLWICFETYQRFNFLIILCA